MDKALLRHRSLWTLGLAESVSGIGNWITMLAVFSLLIFRGGGSVAQSSLVFLAGLVPTLLASPFAGWLCDRLDRKRLLIGSELLSGLVVTGLIFAQRLELIYALLVLQALSMSILTPARQAAVPALVPPADLARANALLSQLAGTVKIGAPMLAGLILSLVDPHTAIALDALSFALSALILSRLPSLPPGARPAPDPASGSHEPATASAGSLWALLGASSLGLLFASSFLTVVVIIGFDALSAIYVRDVLHGGESLYGLLIGMVGVGTVAAATVVLYRRHSRDPWRDLILGIGLLAAIPASLVLVTLLEHAPVAALQALAAAGCLVGGAGCGLINVQSGTLLQMLAPGALLGRFAGALQSTQTAGQLIGLLLTPLLVPALLSMGAYFCAATLALAALALGLLRRRQRSNPLAVATDPAVML